MTGSKDLALLLTSSLAADGDESYPLDNLRMQKAMFLLTQRGTDRWRSAYTYEPYNWGPYSGALTADVRSLVESDLVALESVPTSRYGRYRATPEGERQAATAWTALTPIEQTFLRTVRKYVTSRSFSALLREVYAAYPEFASKSLFSG